MTVNAFILAAGVGKRVGSDKPKQFLELNGLPVIIHSAKTFDKIQSINNIYAVTSKEWRPYTNELFEKFNIKKFRNVVLGGSTRQESSYNSVFYGNFEPNDIIILHDAARPLINESTVTEAINKTIKHGASAVYAKNTDSLAEIENGKVKSILNRDIIFKAQTPQVFKYQILKQAHQFALDNNKIVTDDVALIISRGGEVHITESNSENFKITVKSDLKRAELVIKDKSN